MLPIYDAKPQILDHLARTNRLVLTAPTGSGKTTQVPQILLRSDLITGQIVILQPRRLATRLVAHRVAAELDTSIGKLVGYQTRHDSRIGDDTRIRFVTEGLFLRLFQSDPNLTGIGAVLLDEFHERSLTADTALGLVRRLQETDRPDLRLLVMSATLDARAIAASLECPAIEAHGRAHPIDIRYQPGNPQAPPWERATDALRDLLTREPEGDVLVFMPGAYEIRRTIETAQGRLRNHPEPLAFFPLHGSLPAAQQDRAVAPCPQRKIIVATNVAETSITIDGVRHVVDSGLARVHRHDPRRGIDVLLIEAVSRASTEQRAGRAGRTGPGSCVRLWSSAEQQARPERDLPEIRRLDLADALLQLKSLDVADPLDFPWLEPPDPPAVERAINLLTDLDALNASADLTDIGRQMALLPMHPRLSRLLIAAAERGCLERATLWAALIGERDILTHPPQSRYTRIPDDAYPSDLTVRERAFQQAKENRFDAATCAGLGLHAAACREVDRTCRLYRDTCRRADLKSNRRNRTEDLIQSLLVPFYDHVALRRDPDLRGEGSLHCAMAGQRRVELDPKSVVRQSHAFVALDVRELGAGRNGVRTALSLASAVETSWLEEIHPERIAMSTAVEWNEEASAVEQFETWAYDDLVYHRQSCKTDPAAAEQILVDKIASGDLRLEKWDQSVEQWLHRARLVAALFPERNLTTYDDDDIRLVLHEIIAGGTRYSHVRTRPCLAHVQHALSWNDQQFVEQMAPTHLPLPAGPRLKIEYYPDGPPRGRARIQDLYGLRQTPSVAGGRQPLLLEILAPSFRPVQVTDDLANFWKNTYPEVKKELKRRYPKHEWR